MKTFEHEEKLSVLSAISYRETTRRRWVLEDYTGEGGVGIDEMRSSSGRVSREKAAASRRSPKEPASEGGRYKEKSKRKTAPKEIQGTGNPEDYSMR
ncbi:MAG TPA: hypothetical protein VGF61_23220 [Candidatus Acidoferrum sp.]